jgi:hypothetical protein
MFVDDDGANVVLNHLPYSIGIAMNWGVEGGDALVLASRRSAFSRT